jgi:hypothetical protein
MSNPVFAPLLAYRERLIDILNNDEVWNDGRCARVFDDTKIYSLLETVGGGDFAGEQKETASKILEKMNELSGIMEDIADLIETLTSADEEAANTTSQHQRNPDMSITISNADRTSLEGLVNDIQIGQILDIDRAAVLIQNIPDNLDETLAELLSTAEQAVSDLDNDSEDAAANVAYAIQCINSIIDYRAPETA